MSLKSYTTTFKPRNPFEIKSLPLAGKLYKNRSSKLLKRKFLNRLIPGRPLLTYLFKFLSANSYGKLGVNGKEVDFRVANTQFHSIYFPEYAYSYEAETAFLMDKVVSSYNDLTFWDIGANWGHFSFFISSHPSFKGTVNSFEPSKEVYSDLESLRDQLNLKEKMNCFNFALGEEDSNANLSLPDGLSSGKATVNSESSGESIVVKNFDREFENIKETPHLMKVDAEGFEESIFKGAENFLNNHKPLIIFENWNEKESPETTLGPLEYLETLGYEFYQPTFSTTKNGKRFLVGYGQTDSENSSNELTLVEFSAKERFLLQEQINVFACHKDQKNWILEQFTL